MEIKVNDVYKFSYNEEQLRNLLMPYHCFDGQLIAKERNGELYLEDTYWLSGGSKIFILEEALKRGTLTFICNLDDVEKATENDYNYYDDEDLFDLSYQHRSYKRYFKKKGSERSKNKMKEVLEKKIEDNERVIRWSTSLLKDYKDRLERLENNDLNFYI